MRFSLVFNITGRHRVLPLNYQYPLQGWIYRLIERAGPEFSRFLHDTGYRRGHRSFKLFTFSNLEGKPYKIYPQQGRIAFFGEEIALTVSFYMPTAAEQFIKGLFMGQEVVLGDELNQVKMQVARIATCPRPDFRENMHYSLLTPCIISKVVEGHKHAQYQHPESEGYGNLFLSNLLQKALAARVPVPMLHDAPNIEDWKVEFGDKVKKRGVHIKEHSPEHSHLIGYLYNFTLTAPVELQELGYYAGFGEKNSMGMGMGENKS